MRKRQGSSHIKPIEDPVPVEMRGNLLVVTAESPLPPGSRVHLSLTIPKHAAMTLHGKVVSISSLEKTRYRISIRLHSVSREQTDALVRHLS
ncbi:MAG: PilZ domain-containing protein [Deltaproteobacteria bacterium]|nr:PilZ domain-containing protein [Deltaproteobacteria bacterium]